MVAEAFALSERWACRESSPHHPHLPRCAMVSCAASRWYISRRVCQGQPLGDLPTLSPRIISGCSRPSSSRKVNFSKCFNTVTGEGSLGL